jgi:hypothetical protein
MKNFIEVTEADSVERLLNIKNIVCVQPETKEKMYLSVIYVDSGLEYITVKQSYAEVKKLIEEAT